MRPFTVVWLFHGNPIATRVTLRHDERPTQLMHDHWLVRALGIERDLPPDQAQEYLEDHGGAVCAVIAGHDRLIWEPYDP